MHLVLMAVAPVFILLFYVYFRDKYEKEPSSLLLNSIISCSVIGLPIYFV